MTRSVIVRVAAAAAASLLVTGCFGDTAILLRVVVDDTVGTPEFISVVVQELGDDTGETVSVIERSIDDLSMVDDGTFVTASMALTPGDIIAEGELAIDVAIAARGAIRGTGSVISRLEPRRVNEAIVTIIPLPCDDDPFEGADETGGAVLSDLITPVLPDLVLCPDDEFDSFLTFVPQGWTVLFELQGTAPKQPLGVAFYCLNENGDPVIDPITGAPIETGILPISASSGMLFASGIPEPALCGVYIGRDLSAPDAEAEGYSLTLQLLDFDPGTCVDDPDMPDPLDLTGGGSDCSSPRTACFSVPDVFPILVDEAHLVRAEVIPDSPGLSPDEFFVTIDCEGSTEILPPLLSPERGFGLVMSRTAPSTTPGTEICTASVSGPVGESFTLCADVGDYDTCVEDEADLLPPGTPLPISLGEPVLPFSACRPSDFEPGDPVADHFVVSPGMAPQVCAVLTTPDVPEEGTMLLTIASVGGDGMGSTSSFGYAVACVFLNAASFGNDINVAVSCIRDDGLDPDRSCGNAYSLIVAQP